MHCVKVAAFAALTVMFVGSVERADAGFFSESPADTIIKICKSEDILNHRTGVKFTHEYLDIICPCVVEKTKANAKPEELQALADVLKLPLAERGKASSKNKNFIRAVGPFFRAQGVCYREHPQK